MKTKEMSKSQLPRSLAIPADDKRHFAATQSLLAATAESRADDMRHFAARVDSPEIHKRVRADIDRFSKPLVDFSRFAARVDSPEIHKRVRADIDRFSKSLVDFSRLPEIHKRVRADIDQFSKSLVDFSRLNAGTVKLLEVLPPDFRQATFPYPRLIGGPTEEILNQREPLNEPSTDLTPAVTDDVFVEKVFLVTGSDEAANHLVARVIKKWGFEVITLDEQPNRGRTRIEKFENCRDNVDFAVILLTPDDIGKSKDEQGKPRLRPSLDSIFGLGACMTHPGRDRICCLYKGKLELPSTMDGIIPIPMDPYGGWKWKLVREMKAAGLPVELKGVM